MANPLHELGSLQAEVMELIWKFGEATVAQLADSIGKKRPVTYTTVLSAVQKLEKKGWLKHRSEGRAYVFSATRDRQQASAQKLKELLRTAFSGDPRSLLASLIDDVRLSDSDLKELQRLIAARQKERRDG